MLPATSSTSHIFHTRNRVYFKKYKEIARAFVADRLMFFNTHYKYVYRRVSIRNQVSRWGSCSSKGNLNFNYKIIFLPKECADYIIVHELCHLKEMNHGPGFWNLVAEVVPEYKKIEQTLRTVTARTY